MSTSDSAPRTSFKLTQLFLTAWLATFAQNCWSLEVDFYSSGAYAELVDRGTVTITASVAGYPPSPPVGLVLDCGATATSFLGSEIHFELKLKLGNQPEAPCFGRATLTVGPLRAGPYFLTAHLVDNLGQPVADAQTTLTILPVSGRCNASPQITPQIIAQPSGVNAVDVYQRILTDPSFAALLGNPSVEPTFQGSTALSLNYSPLTNPSESRVRLEDTGQFSRVWENEAACFPESPGDSTGTVTEFYNAALQHYFYTSDPNEKAVLNRGDIPGWAATEESFPVTTSPGCAIPTPSRATVYRFYGLPGAGVGTHFFTIERNECYLVDRSNQWMYEGVAFWASNVNPDRSCPTGLQALYRAWRPFGDSEHRYTTKLSIVDQMTAQGWIAEGAVMCVLSQ